MNFALILFYARYLFAARYYHKNIQNYIYEVVKKQFFHVFVKKLTKKDEILRKFSDLKKKNFSEKKIFFLRKKFKEIFFGKKNFEKKNSKNFF